MDIARALRTYVMEDEFQINILKGRVGVVGYDTIGHFDTNKIIIRHQNGNVIIKGKNLVISKLLRDEILITGKIEMIELG